MRQVKRLHRECENSDCNVIKEYYPHDIHRGKAIYCSRRCAQFNRHTPTYQCTCTACGNPFRSTIENNDSCCVECENLNKLKKSKNTTRNQNPF